MTFLGTSMRDLYRERDAKRKRASSYDTTGGNRDYFAIHPGEKVDICELTGAGCITHIWMTMAPLHDDIEAFLHRKVVIRMYWDGETSPSVQAPIGDFFGMGHGITKNFWSAPLQMSPEDGRSLNCFFSMPFANNARIEIESNADAPIKFYFYVDYEQYQEIDSDLRFHALWRRERTQGVDENISNALYSFGGKNTTGEQNYVLLDTIGKGHYVGCNLNIHNLRFTQEWNWYGEGDDMIFIDGEPWPPSLHGTGMEDYFNTAWCPQQEQNTPYHGIILGGGPNWSGKISAYRYHIQDPIMFDQSIKVTIEHGHNNNRSDDYASTAYWYQTKPGCDFAPILPVKNRLPLPDTLPFNPEDMKKCFDY
ncbi:MULTISPECIES: glycoside hydrolase family 172 protein [Gracilibacillus]|uniref:glycoside hydrolase family 172 protein n=1 Tax=Gracilibacillus TaxID=74385 RepID=UPI0008246AF7|nr:MULTISPECIES: glycoside hydrolase family 172 protein [Gracilibacillus]